MRSGTKLSYVEKELFKIAEKIQRIVSRKFKIHPKIFRVFPKSDPHIWETVGTCRPDSREIRLRLTHPNTGKLISINSLVDTIIHELVHLEYPTHNKNFWKRHREIKSWFLTNYVKAKE